jgi:capsular polysaccharide biosynthesis protein
MSYFSKTFDRIYISRKNVVSRKIVNEEEVMQLFNKYAFQEIFPEDYNMQQMAYIMANASAVASVHGSGLSNLPFIKNGTKVLDILAPLHQDTYYWMICNQRKASYIGFFAEGNHPPDDLDLVKNSVDNDLLLDLKKLETALLMLISN